MLKRHKAHYNLRKSLWAGAWTSKLLTQYHYLDVVGVKGEVLLIENDHLDLKETVFMTNGCYIVPKYPNRFLIGATSEFDNYW